MAHDLARASLLSTRQRGGRVWQGRFKAFPIQEDEHYLTVLRYVERNPLRANLVQRSQDWEWSSLKPTGRSGPDGVLVDGPVVKPDSRTQFVNGAETESELKALRQSVERGRRLVVWIGKSRLRAGWVWGRLCVRWAGRV
ncbi:transposase [Schlesneria sp. DSM 10557]|uniref:transposase n=1 Tax=Schlesneria sp. DSM 10557 TaxID=3044399 RepID=UPI00359F5FDC